MRQEIPVGLGLYGKVGEPAQHFAPRRPVPPEKRLIGSETAGNEYCRHPGFVQGPQVVVPEFVFHEYGEAGAQPSDPLPRSGRMVRRQVSDHLRQFGVLTAFVAAGTEKGDHDGPVRQQASELGQYRASLLEFPQAGGVQPEHPTPGPVQSVDRCVVQCFAAVPPFARPLVARTCGQADAQVVSCHPRAVKPAHSVKDFFAGAEVDRQDKANAKAEYQVLAASRSGRAG